MNQLKEEYSLRGIVKTYSEIYSFVLIQVSYGFDISSNLLEGFNSISPTSIKINK